MNEVVRLAKRVQATADRVHQQLLPLFSQQQEKGEVAGVFIQQQRRGGGAEVVVVVENVKMVKESFDSLPLLHPVGPRDT